MNLVDKEKFSMIVSGDPNYGDLIAEIEFGGDFFCIVSQENGIDNLDLQIASRKDGMPWDISVAELIYVIEIASKRLWELRKV